jgi:cell wall-associated NlpC family hydrolase
MKRFYQLSAGAGLVLILSACGSRIERAQEKLEPLLESMRSTYAPDDRFEYWGLSLSEEAGFLFLQGEVTSQEAYQALSQEMKKQFPKIRNEVLLIPGEGEEPVVDALVNNSVIHLRRQPSSKTELITQARLGAPVRILMEKGGKTLIRIPDGYIGWVNPPEVFPVDSAALQAYRQADKIIYYRQYGFAYSAADTDSLPVSDLVIGNILARTGEQGDFFQVGYPDGRTGWVKKDEVVPAGEIFFKTTTREGVVQTALQFHGIPYLWGGTSSKNIDCSGLVANAYFLNGTQLPRDGDLQSLCGREVSTRYTADGLEPGDLLFFGRKATEDQEEDITHVALYIGNGEFIHSAGWRERVSINSLDPARDNYIERYPEIYIRTVRIIGEEPNIGEEYRGFRPIYENAFYKEIIQTNN